MAELMRRISDFDRDRAATVLHEAVADGRLSWAEHSERLTAVYEARTDAELAGVLSDLQAFDARPPSWGAARALPSSAAGPLRVTLGKVRRTGEPNTTQYVRAALGAAVIDLRRLPPGCTLELQADSFLGKVEVYVSPDTEVIDSGSAWLGKRSTVERVHRNLARSGAPVVRIGGHSVLGHVRVTIG